MDENRLDVLDNLLSCSCPNQSDIVPFRGPNPAELVIVGDNPGLIEVEQKDLFVGPAGQMLRNHLTNVGFDLATIGWMNVISCYTADTPSKEAVAACKPNFKAQLEMFSPKWVLLLGAVALKAVHPFLEISKARGNPFKHEDYGDVVFFPTFHPAFGLRNKQGDRQISIDIATLREITKSDSLDPFLATTCGHCGIEASYWGSDLLGWGQCSNAECGFPSDLKAKRAETFMESDGLSCRKTGCSTPADRHPVSFASGQAPEQMSWSALSGHHQKLMQAVWTGGNRGVEEAALKKALRLKSSGELLGDLEKLHVLGWILPPEAERHGWVISPRGRMTMEMI